ncbi:hypothetical protein GOQ27_07735 [Clostridium sp. D2Q-11]|uniref:NADH:quinone oxidoreductase/Mrp antiporter transmembrane domain-containing protein n=1 Tax=Anaeromonas frigoriresistens TaxID=2683708 RepID=A0A942UXX4_9FIRM|nr:proton-conducting transporter membrane subunit [Anaeromonas frigoriresistens]MBS4538351.1 hypothetical protein [Anaeromonas frigoriresistens]
MENFPIYMTFTPILAAMIIYLGPNKYITYLTFIAQGILSILVGVYAIKFNFLKTPQIIFLGGWSREIGITLRMDTLSILFIVLTVFIWWMIIIYSWNRRKEDFKFLFFLLVLEGAFIAFLQSDDIFNIFVLLELITILSTILIIYKKDGYSVRAGLYYLIFNSVGMIFFLLGLILLYSLSGTLNMEVISRRISMFENTALVRLSYIFIIASLGVKSAFFPVYTWLPRAHGAAPASISALLSGLLVKSGLYAFIRINQMYDIQILQNFFFILGVCTAISGAIIALSQNDIKQILAFSTISQIGIILVGLSSFKEGLYIGGIAHIFNHAIFKSLLFLGAGAILNRYGTRRVTEIRGVFKESPLLSIFMIIGILSITGAPLFNGYISKTIIKYGITNKVLGSTFMNIMNILTIMYFMKFSQIFFGESIVNTIRDIGNTLALGILALVSMALGIYMKGILEVSAGIDLSYIYIFSIKSLIEYLLSILIGYIIYKKIVEKDINIMKRIRHFNLSFEIANIMLVAFIFIMILWVRFPTS